MKSSRSKHVYFYRKTTPQKYFLLSMPCLVPVHTQDVSLKDFTLESVSLCFLFETKQYQFIYIHLCDCKTSATIVIALGVNGSLLLTMSPSVESRDEDELKEKELLTDSGDRDSSRPSQRKWVKHQKWHACLIHKIVWKRKRKRWTDGMKASGRETGQETRWWQKRRDWYRINVPHFLNKMTEEKIPINRVTNSQSRD